MSPISPIYATIGRILSEDATAEMAADVRPAVVLAHRAGLPFRLTELNSVTCGGRRGVSNTFASALWGPDALFELMRARVDGVNVHVRAYAVNDAFGLGANRIVPHPVERLLAPSVRATTGETLGGQRLGIDDGWVGRPSREAIVPTGGRYELTVPATSAALVQLQTEARAR